jgi:hypothetical protein
MKTMKRHQFVRKSFFLMSGIVSLLALAGCLVLNGRLPGAGGSPAGLDGSKIDKEQKIPALDLRGYGQVKAEGWQWIEKNRDKISLVRFSCQDADSAKVLASKYVTDMLAYGAVKKIKTPEGLGGTALSVRHGGKWLVGIDGSNVLVASAQNSENLHTAGQTWGAANWNSVPENSYPRWLDCFDNAAWGVSWRDLLKTDEQLSWMKNHPSVPCYRYLFFDAQSPAPGVIDLNTSGHTLAQIKQLGKPYRFLEFLSTTGNNGWLNWFQQPGPQVSSDPTGYCNGWFYHMGGYYAHQMASPEVNAVLKNAMLNMTRQVGDDTDLMCWWEPHGELQYMYPERTPPNAAKRYPEFLRDVKKYTLTSVSEAYTGNPKTYKSWSDLIYPEAAYFNGRRGLFMDLDKEPWHWKPGNRDDGLKQGWERTNFNDSSWALNKRTSVRLAGAKDLPVWVRFKRDCSNFLAKAEHGKKIYLHLLLPHSSRQSAPEIWLNGEPVKCRAVKIASGVCESMEAEISGKLTPGTNHFAIAAGGCGRGRESALAYRVFLNTEPDTGFPAPDEKLTRRYLDWKDYQVWEMFNTIAEFVKAKRSVDPNRPILLAVPYAILPDSFYRFAEEYGVVPYLTGEGAYYRPHNYKGYTSLRRLPSASEPGGPAKNAKSMQYMASCIFWESQDCFNYFHEFRDVWKRPDVKKWWTDNKALLQTMGKTDFGAHRLGELRDYRQDRKYGRREIWKWDLGRGALPALGLTPVLIDGPDFEEGAADHVPVIIDDATTVMAPPMLDALERYVRNGGTFIAQHHTGQHSETRLNSWPLAARLGLHIEPRYIDSPSKDGTKWGKSPMAQISFTEKQTLFPDLRGKTLMGSGVSIDYLNQEHSGAVSITGKGKNVQPIALWKDGSMAIAEIRLGRGRIILLGTPFYARLQDMNGCYFNNAETQKLLQKMLALLGVKRETDVSDDRIWFERRESKNGLYHVYFGCAMGERNKDWNLDDKIASELLILGRAPSAIVETSTAELVDVPVKSTPTGASLGTQVFSPYQVRQFAAIRDNVGIDGPLHWLENQRRFWRKLKSVDPNLTKRIAEDAALVTASLGESGLNLNKGWKVRPNPANAKDPSWITAPVSTLSGDNWINGNIESWSTAGYPKDMRVAQYRKTVQIPESWKDKKIFFGVNRSYQMHGGDIVKIWINGTNLIRTNKGIYSINITKDAKGGVLNLAMEVENHGSLASGPIFTAYLRSMPKPIETIPLTNNWVRLKNWEHDGTPVKIPMSGEEGTIFGLRTQVDIPKQWEGHPIRLIIDYDPKSSLIQGVIFNDEGYCNETDWTIGMRVDRWIKPRMKNDLVLMPNGHTAKSKYRGAKDLRINSVRLEVFPKNVALTEHKLSALKK